MAEREGGNRPSIEDGVYKRTSVSQAGTFDLCPLKWYLDKKVHLPRKPPGKGAALGAKLHAQIEHYAKTGEDVRGPIPKRGDWLLEPYRKHLPFMGGRALVETSLSDPWLVTPGGVEFVGYLDLLIPPGNPLSNPIPVIIDHKFKKDLDRYGASEESLKADTQAIVYSHWAMLRYHAEAVEFRLHEHQTEKAATCRPVSHTFTRNDVLAKFNVIAAHIDNDIAPIAALSDIDQVPYNHDGCGAYGGCDFEDVCPRSKKKMWLDSFALPTEMKEGNMGLLNTIAAQKAAVNAPPPAAVRVGGNTPANACKIDAVYQLADGILAAFKGLAGESAFFMAISDNSPRVVQAGSLVTDPAVNGVTPVTAIIAQMKAEGAVTTPAPAPAVVTASAPVAVVPPDAPASTPTPAAAVATATAAPVTEAIDKPKRGRPPKTAADKAELADQIGIGGLVLLVNCATSRPATDLNGFVSDLAKSIAETTGLIDVRLANNDHALAYGKWKAVLGAAAVKASPTGLCQITTGELNDPVIEALSGVASLVVRGGR